jgi:serine/threonine-protein kinase
LGLVHCDVCPQNILVGVDGAARLTDFGIAQTKESLKLGETLRGKPRYIAPERLERSGIDARADVFSMGGVLYSGLTGIDAFAGETTEETRWNVSHKDPAPPSQVGFRSPPALDWVVQKALSKDLGSRFHSAEEFATQLRRVAEREGLLASRAEVGEWVREVLGPSLRARRVAAQRGTGGIARTQPPPPVGGEETPVERDRASNTAPISSSQSSVENTQILTDEEQETAGNASSRRGLYVAVALVLLVVAWAILAPDSLSKLFEVSPASDQFVPSAEGVGDDVVVPEISAPFEGTTAPDADSQGVDE